MLEYFVLSYCMLYACIDCAKNYYVINMLNLWSNSYHCYGLKHNCLANLYGNRKPGYTVCLISKGFYGLDKSSPMPKLTSSINYMLFFCLNPESFVTVSFCMDLSYKKRKQQSNTRIRISNTII